MSNDQEDVAATYDATFELTNGRWRLIGMVKRDVP